ncbi:MAG: hypothetical protein WC301_04640 [Candidatus Omnitrophota bacterium]|jgi:hypothetical protein
MPEDRNTTTPEKQLLRLIEDNKAAPGSKTGYGARIRRGAGFLSSGVWLGRLSFLKDKLKAGLTGRQRTSFLDIKVINNFLIACIFVLTVYVVFSFSFSWGDLDKLPGAGLNMQPASALSLDTDGLELKREVSFYLDKVENRDIFKMGPKNPAVAKGEPSSKAIEATKHLKLVGISWSDNPDAMIEDSKAVRTFFLKRGQMIGDVKIVAIFKDKVVLNYAGEDIDLK